MSILPASSVEAEIVQTDSRASSYAIFWSCRTITPWYILPIGCRGLAIFMLISMNGWL